MLKYCKSRVIYIIFLALSLLIEIWKKCSVTDCPATDVLRASHIKPWRFSTNTERLDPYNGLLLIPNLDALFDIGLISFKDNGEIIISNRLSSATLESLSIYPEMRLQRVDNQYFTKGLEHG